MQVKRLLLISLFTLFAPLSAQDTLKILVSDKSDFLYPFETQIMSDLLDLYNSKHAENINYIFYPASYQKTFQMMKQANPTDLICSINSITITAERQKKFDFSSGYFPTGEAIFTRKNFQYLDNDWLKKGTRIGFTEHSIYDKLLDRYVQSHGIIKVPFQNWHLKNGALAGKEINYVIGDILEEHIFNNIKQQLVVNGNKSTFYGIMYPKNSVLRQKLEPILKYYIKSPKYHKLVKKYMGQKTYSYYQSVMNTF